MIRGSNKKNVATNKKLNAVWEGRPLVEVLSSFLHKQSNLLQKTKKDIIEGFCSFC
jgi:hypothetical protein